MPAACGNLATGTSSARVVARLRNLAPDAIEGFSSDGTLALEASTAIILGPNGLSAVEAKKAQERGHDVVALFECERAAEAIVWRVFDPTFELRVQGERLHQVPFAILSGADVVSRGFRLRLRFEAPFAPVSFGGFIPPMPFEQGTLLNPIIGTAPFFFRAAAERGNDVELMSASYGARGMELLEPTTVWRLCTLAEANASQGGMIPQSVLVAIAQQLVRQSQATDSRDAFFLEDTAINERGEVVAFGASPSVASSTAAKSVEDLHPAERHCARVAELIAALSGRPRGRDANGDLVHGENGAEAFWEILRLSPRGRALEWTAAILALDAAEPAAVQRWAAAVLPETTEAMAEANEQIAMMRPLDLFKLRLQSIAANSRAAI